jgi:hypothetical protein
LGEHQQLGVRDDHAADQQRDRPEDHEEQVTGLDATAQLVEGGGGHVGRRPDVRVG